MRLLRSELRRNSFEARPDVSLWTLGRGEAALQVLGRLDIADLLPNRASSGSELGVVKGQRERLVEAYHRSLRRRLVLLPANRRGWGLPTKLPTMGLPHQRNRGVAGVPRAARTHRRRDTSSCRVW